jgi:hypothetical protein
MYTTMLASSYWLHPATSTPTGITRAYRATFFVALGAIVGWPFAAALGIPFVVEQLFLTGGDVAVGQDKQALMIKRWTTMGKAVAVGACIAVSLIIRLVIQLSPAETSLEIVLGLIHSDPCGNGRLMGIRPIHFPHPQHCHIQHLLQRRS